MKLLTLFTIVVSAAFGQSFQAELDGPLWKEKSGELHFTPDALEFLPKGEEVLPPVLYSFPGKRSCSLSFLSSIGFLCRL